jgi:hypothetical protein
VWHGSYVQVQSTEINMMAVTVRGNPLVDLRDILATQLANDGFKVAPDDDHDTLLVRHLNVAQRRIQAHPRPVLWSKELRAREADLPKEIQEALQRIQVASWHGKDLTPYLSRKIVGNKKDADFTDHSVSEWAIHHLHLGAGLARDGKIKGTNELLFAVACDDALYFIDVLDHGSFAEQRLFDIVVANWPDLFERYRVPTIVLGRDPTQRTSAEDRAVARRNGINAMTMGPDGCAYVSPGGGIATNRSSSWPREQADRILDAIEAEYGQCLAHAQEIAGKIFVATGRKLDVLDLKLIHIGDGALKILETQTQVLLTQTNTTDES